MKPQLDPQDISCKSVSNKRRITKRKEDTNLIRKNCKEIWDYISEREEAGKEWSVWFPIAMTGNKLRWVLGTRLRCHSVPPEAPLVCTSETKRSSILVTQWREFYRCHYKGESIKDSRLSDSCKAHLKYILESGHPIYNERLVKIYPAIGTQCKMFCWTHDSKGTVFWNTLFDDESPHGTTPPAIQVYESFLNVVMSDTLDHAL